jgi:PAS domain S-box-containing protein
VSSRQKQWLDQVGSALESLNQGVIISDEDRRIIFANSMFLEIGKMSAEDILGRSVMDLYPADEVGRLREFIARRRIEGRAQYEFYIPQSDGGRLPVEIRSCMAAMDALTELLRRRTSAKTKAASHGGRADGFA